MIRYGWFVLSILLALVSLPFMVHADDKKSPYPPSRVDNVVDKLHDVEVADPYRWLEDGKSAEVKEWVARQNALTQSLLEKLPDRKAIRARLESLLEIGTLGTPALGGAGISSHAARESKISRSSTSAKDCADRNACWSIPIAWPRTAPLPWTGGIPVATASCWPMVCRRTATRNRRSTSWT